jgi:site-specific DNA recombinase
VTKSIRRKQLAAGGGTDRSYRVGTYRRISTNEQNQPYSLEAQERSLRLFIDSQPNMTFTKDYVDRSTGTNNQRPGLEAALRDAEEGVIDLVLIYRLDRLSRSVVGLMEIVNGLEAHGAMLRSATEPFETMTPAGKMVVQMLASIAEFEHDVLIDRILEGFDSKAARGEWLGGPAPYGYVLDRTRKSLTIDAVEGAAVRRIFDLYLAGDGAKAVAEKLNAAGMRKRKGREWDQLSVLRILEGVVYGGFILHADEQHPGLHEPLVTVDELERANKQRGERSNGGALAGKAKMSTDYVLTGLLTCGVCGGAYVGANAHGQNQRYRYYICNLQTKRSNAEKCRNERVDADGLEQMVLGKVIETYADSELFERALAAAASGVPEQEAQLAEQAMATQTTIARTEKALERYYEAFESGKLNADDLGRRVEDLSMRLTAQRGELARVLEEQTHLGMSQTELVDLSTALTEVTRVLAAPGGHREKKVLLSALVASIQVQRGRVVDVVLRVPTMQPGASKVVSRAQRRRATSRPESAGGKPGDSDEIGEALIRKGVASLETPVRMGSQVVEMLGIEPRSISFLVNILRAQPAEDCRERHYCWHRCRSLVSSVVPTKPLTSLEGKPHFMTPDL